MIRSTLTRKTIVTDPAEFEKRQKGLDARLLPLLQRQPGFVSYEMLAGEVPGAMTQVTSWKTSDDCRAYLRNGGAAMAATILDAFFPTAPYPDGNWLRENVEVS